MPPKDKQTTACERAFLERAEELAPQLTEQRRKIHRHPELGLENPRTQEFILAELGRIGVPVRSRGVGCTSVVAEIEGTASDQKAGLGRGRCVALRADTDALPLTEHNDVEWVSAEPGRMHACGHDAHTAMLLGAAELLTAQRSTFAGTVRLLFQPGEEGFGGAKVMIEEGALEGVDAAFALHVDSARRCGQIALRAGPMMASNDTFWVTFRGAGGHASMPYNTLDPIPAIGPFVDGLSHVAARETHPDDRAVFSVTRLEAGTAFNVIPPLARCGGTIRCISAERRRLAHDQLRRVAVGVAASRNLEVDIELNEGYPPTLNHAGPVHRTSQVASRLGLDVFEMPSAMMGAEDFSYVLAKVPGAFAFIGAQIEGGGPLHSDLMKIDEAVLPKGAALHAAMALELLAAETL